MCIPPDLLVKYMDFIVYTYTFNHPSPVWYFVNELPEGKITSCDISRKRRNRLWVCGEFGVIYSDDFLEETPTWETSLTIEEINTAVGADVEWQGVNAVADLAVSHIDADTVIIALHVNGSPDTLTTAITHDSGVTWDFLPISEDLGLGVSSSPGISGRNGWIQPSELHKTRYTIGLMSGKMFTVDGILTELIADSTDFYGLGGGYYGPEDTILLSGEPEGNVGIGRGPGINSATPELYTTHARCFAYARDTQKIYVNVFGFPAEDVDGELWVSNDLGETYTFVSEIEFNGNDYIGAMIAHSDNILIRSRFVNTDFVNMIEVSEDGGQTWSTRLGNLETLVGESDVNGKYSRIHILWGEFEIEFHGVAFSQAEEGAPVSFGDRGAFDVVNYPERHANDIEMGQTIAHLPTPGQENTVMVDDGDSWGRRNLYGVLEGYYDTVSEDYTLGLYKVVYVNAAIEDIDITFPSNSGEITQLYYLKRIDSTSNVVNLLPPGGGAIEGYATLATGQGILFANAGSVNWYALAEFGGRPTRQVVFTVTGELAVTTGAIRIPNILGYAVEFVGVRLDVAEAPAGNDIYVQVNKNGSQIFDSLDRPRIEIAEFTGFSDEFNTPYWLEDEYLTVDIDQVGTTPGSDLTVTILVR